MNDEGPLDLHVLDPEDIPDVAAAAIRRFRWRVVVSTVVIVIAGAALLGWAVGEYLEDRRIERMLADVDPARRAIVDDSTGAYACATPSVVLAGFEVAILRAVPLEGGWALHVVVHGDRLANGTGRFTTLAPVGEGARSVQVPAQAGATWADAYIAVPAALGDRFDVALRDVRSELVGTFPVDVTELACDFS